MAPVVDDRIRRVWPSVLIVVAIVALGLAATGVVSFITTPSQGGAGYRLTSLWPAGVPEDASTAARLAGRTGKAAKGGDGGETLVLLALVGAVAAFVSASALRRRACAGDHAPGDRPATASATVRASLAAAGTATAIAAVTVVVFAVVRYPTASLKGSTEGLGVAWWSSFSQAALRVALVVGLGAAVGTAVAAARRATTVTAAVVLVYLVVIEVALETGPAVIRPLLVTVNVRLWLTGEDRTDWGPEDLARPMWVGLLVVVVYALFLGALTAEVRRRRVSAS